jgi:hypothetical protein
MADEDNIFDIIPEETQEDNRSSNLEVFNDEEQQEMVLDYLIEEIQLAEDERQIREQKWKTFRRQSKALPENASKNFPWAGASNVSPPLMMSIVHTITSKLVASFADKKPLWKVEPRDEAWKDHANALTEYLNLLAVSRNHLNITDKKRSVFYDLARLGDQVIHLPWIYKQQKFRANTVEGTEEEVVKVLQDSPGFIPLRIEDFFVRGHFTNIQDAPWVARRNRFYYHELTQKAAQGVFTNVDQLTLEASEPTDDNAIADKSDLGIQVTDDNVKESTVFDIYEAYLFYDIDGDGVQEDIIVTFEPSTKTILRTEYNKLGLRPFENISYIKMPHSFYSLGVGDITTGMQQEAETLHNMDIDGRHLGMMQMKIARRGTGLDEDTEYYPGKTIIVDDLNDFTTFTFPDISEGAFRAEQRASAYAREASGATAQMAGQDESAGNRLGASGTMFLAQQANTILDSVRDNISEAFSRIGFLVITQLVANSDRVDYSMVSEYEANLLKEIFALDIHTLPTTFKLDVRTTEMQETDEARRQGYMSIWQIYSQFGQEMIQVAGMLGQGGMPEGMTDAVASYYVGKVKMMKEMLEHFQVDNVDDFVPYVRNLELMLENLDAQKDQQLGVDRNGNPTQQSSGNPVEASTGQAVSQVAGGNAGAV